MGLEITVAILIAKAAFKVFNCLYEPLKPNYFGEGSEDNIDSCIVKSKGPK